jgi:hypothetical protein
LLSFVGCLERFGDKKMKNKEYFLRDWYILTFLKRFNLYLYTPTLVTNSFVLSELQNNILRRKFF